MFSDESSLVDGQEEIRDFDDFIEEAVEAANFLEGYGRFFKRKFPKDWDEERTASADKVRRAVNAREGLNVEVRKLRAMEAQFVEDVKASAFGLTLEEQDEHKARIVRQESKVVAKAWIVERLRQEIDGYLKQYRLQPRRKYSRVEQVEEDE